MKILAGNWKMNTTFEEGYTLIEALKTELSPERLGEVVVVLAPPVVQLTQAIDLLIDYLKWRSLRRTGTHQTPAHSPGK
jgi:triosephosphate isomerase